MSRYHVIVRMNGEPDFIFPLKGTEYVNDLKTIIQYRFRIPKEDQLLLLGSRPLMRTHRFFGLYGPNNRSIIDLHKKHKDTTFEVTVVSEDGVLITAIPNMSSEDNVSKIKDAVESKIGVFYGRQLVTFEGEGLGGTDLLRDFSVTSQPTVTFAANPYHQKDMFNVQIVEGKIGHLVSEFLVHPHDRVAFLEWVVRGLEVTRERSFQIFLGTRILSGLDIMEELGVRHNQVFSLIFKDQTS